MTITFYKMEGCGFCTKAEDLLKDHINKDVIIKGRAKAPSGVSGFPHFVNEANGKSHTGYPQTVENLFKKLDYKPKRENYAPLRKGLNTETRQSRLPAGQRAPQPKYSSPQVYTEAANSGFEKNWFYGVL